MSEHVRGKYSTIQKWKYFRAVIFMYHLIVFISGAINKCSVCLVASKEFKLRLASVQLNSQSYR